MPWNLICPQCSINLKYCTVIMKFISSYDRDVLSCCWLRLRPLLDQTGWSPAVSSGVFVQWLILPCHSLQRDLSLSSVAPLDKHGLTLIPASGLAIDILKMESWTLMGCTLNIIIKYIIHIFGSISKNMLILLMGWCYRECWACVSNYIHHKVWDEITYPFLNFNGCTIEV